MKNKRLKLGKGTEEDEMKERELKRLKEENAGKVR